LLTWKPAASRTCPVPDNNCIKIYAADMTTVLRTEGCRHWCPLLGVPTRDAAHQVRAK
jgi:hypothetical protein